MTYRTVPNTATFAAVTIPPLLATLGLSEAALHALGRQGFVSSEYRGRRGPFFKLRFRLAGRQIVRYLGQDAVRAAQLENELQTWQAGRQAELELSQLCTAARKLLRTAKRELAGPLEAAGFHFHGRAIRAKSPRG